jgi:hypothetical protein
MTTKNRRTQPAAEGILEAPVGQPIGSSRAMLSSNQRKCLTATAEQLPRIDTAIVDSITNRQQLVKSAAQAGLFFIGLRL